MRVASNVSVTAAYRERARSAVWRSGGCSQFRVLGCNHVSGLHHISEFAIRDSGFAIRIGIRDSGFGIRDSSHIFGIRDSKHIFRIRIGASNHIFGIRDLGFGTGPSLWSGFGIRGSGIRAQITFTTFGSPRAYQWISIPYGSSRLRVHAMRLQATECFCRARGSKARRLPKSVRAGGLVAFFRSLRCVERVEVEKIIIVSLQEECISCLAEESQCRPASRHKSLSRPIFQYARGSSQHGCTEKISGSCHLVSHGSCILEGPLNLFVD